MRRNSDTVDHWVYTLIYAFMWVKFGKSVAFLWVQYFRYVCVCATGSLIRLSLNCLTSISWGLLSSFLHQLQQFVFASYWQGYNDHWKWPQSTLGVLHHLGLMDSLPQHVWAQNNLIWMKRRRIQKIELETKQPVSVHRCAPNTVIGHAGNCREVLRDSQLQFNFVLFLCKCL